MRILGVLLLLLGIAAIVAVFAAPDLEYVKWIDQWGTNAGWAIRIGAVVLGLILIALGKPKPKK